MLEPYAPFALPTSTTKLQFILGWLLKKGKMTTNSTIGRIKSLKWCLPTHHVESLFPSDYSQDREKAFFLTQMLSFEKWVASFHFFGSIESPPPQLATSSKQYYKRGWISIRDFCLNVGQKKSHFFREKNTTNLSLKWIPRKDFIFNQFFGAFSNTVQCKRQEWIRSISARLNFG